MPIKLAWNAIVKNEGARIERAMKSLLPYISCMVVLDTGSTDNTIDQSFRFNDAQARCLEYPARRITGTVS